MEQYRRLAFGRSYLLSLCRFIPLQKYLCIHIKNQINAGADVMTTNDDGLTPLQHAVYHNNEYVVKALLKELLIKN